MKQIMMSMLAISMFSMLGTVSVYAETQRESIILVDGVPIQHNVNFREYEMGIIAPIIGSEGLNSSWTSGLPLRETFEALGGNVIWDDETRTSTLTTEAGNVIVFSIVDNRWVAVNGSLAMFYANTPQLVDGRILVSRSFVANATGYHVFWNGDSWAVEIETNDPGVPRRLIRNFTPEPMTEEVSVFERRVFELTNIERANNGDIPLAWDNRLWLAARDHSEDMARTRLGGHIGSDGSWPSDRARRRGFYAGTSGENVSLGSATPEAVVEGWMRSPEHRDAILGGGVHFIGVARAQGWTTQKFGTVSEYVFESMMEPSGRTSR